MLKLDREWSCRKYDLNCCILKRTGRATTTKPYRNKAAHHGLVLKIRSLKQNPSYDANTFRRMKQEGRHNSETSPNYNDYEASQGLCGELSSKTKKNRTSKRKQNWFTVCTIRILSTSAAPQALMGSEPTGHHSLFRSKPLQMLCLTVM